MLGAHNEVTGLKLTEERLVEQALDLKRSNARLEQFAYAASHDLQAPLRTIEGFVTLLEHDLEEQLDPKHRQYMQNISAGVTQMRELVRGLLRYSRVGRDKDTHPVALGEVVDRVRGALQADLVAANANVVVGNLPTVPGRALELQQLFQNLFENAVRYRHADRDLRISVSAESSDDRIHIAVEDNGIGIHEDFQDKVFAIFKRLHTSEERGAGAGIGLALCRRIVESHRGDIRLESDGHSGTAARFWLPAGAEATCAT